MFIQSDVTGIHQLFVRDPGWFPTFDMDGPKAEATRRAFFDRVIAEKGMIAGYHFGFPNVGAVEGWQRLCLRGCDKRDGRLIQTDRRRRASHGALLLHLRWQELRYGPGSANRPGIQRYDFSAATPSISISICGLGGACTTQVVRAGIEAPGRTPPA